MAGRQRLTELCARDSDITPCTLPMSKINCSSVTSPPANKRPIYETVEEEEPAVPDIVVKHNIIRKWMASLPRRQTSDRMPSCREIAAIAKTEIFNTVPTSVSSVGFQSTDEATASEPEVLLPQEKALLHALSTKEAADVRRELQDARRETLRASSRALGMTASMEGKGMFCLQNLAGQSAIIDSIHLNTDKSCLSMAEARYAVKQMRKKHILVRATRRVLKQLGKNLDTEVLAGNPAANLQWKGRPADIRRTLQLEQDKIRTRERALNRAIYRLQETVTDRKQLHLGTNEPVVQHEETRRLMELRHKQKTVLSAAGSYVSENPLASETPMADSASSSRRIPAWMKRGKPKKNKQSTSQSVFRDLLPPHLHSLLVSEVDHAKETDQRLTEQLHQLRASVTRLRRVAGVMDIELDVQNGHLMAATTGAERLDQLMYYTDRRVEHM